MTRKPSRRSKRDVVPESNSKVVKRGLGSAIAVFSLGVVRDCSRRYSKAKKNSKMAARKAAYINDMGTKKEEMHFDNKGRDFKN